VDFMDALKRSLKSGKRTRLKMLPKRKRRPAKRKPAAMPPKKAKAIKKKASKKTNTKKAATKAARKKPAAKVAEASNNSPTMVAGVTLSHPDKVLYPEQDLTKLDLATYYEQISAWMLPQVVGRPISLVRCPAGEGKACFFQRHAGSGNSKAIREFKVAGKGDGQAFITIDDVEGLVALVQMGVLEIHAWGARADKPDLPDRIVFDFDPHEDVSWSRIKGAALEMRRRLSDIKLESFLKTTGGKGLHVVVPIARKPDWDTVKSFAHAMAQLMADDMPKFFTTNSRKAERVGRIFIDYLRNDQTASAIAPYSTRARQGAPVSVPLGWDELEKLAGPNSFMTSSVLRRIKTLKADPWKDIDKLPQRLPALPK
jgi:bifunctional non-homologous end joining protein LigD